MTVETITHLKNISYLVAFTASVEWLGFEPLTIYIFTVLMIIDIFTGLSRSYLVEGGKAIRSNILKRGILSKMLLMAGLFSIALTGKASGYDVTSLTQAALVVLTFGELYSILGNIHSARTGADKVEFDAVSFILDRVKELLDKFTQ